MSHKLSDSQLLYMGEQSINDASESIDSVYVPLTILRKEPREVNPEDDTTYDQIAFLRKIMNKPTEIKSINLTQELNFNDPFQPEILCVIGYSGSGKTFICHEIALQFGKGKLLKISYALAIPCRHTGWHKMESDQYNTNTPIDKDFIQKWLELSMPVGPNWTSDLAKHIIDTAGNGVLLIIDGMDEYIKEIPFQETILFHLLTRKILTQSTILLTSRPAAYTTISSSHTLLIEKMFHVLGFTPANMNLYFRKQLSNDEEKLEQLKELLAIHKEMNHLCLVPANASLFADLIRGSGKLSACTLTQLYTERVTYSIRRQLTRMGLKEMAQGKFFLQRHPNVLECLYRIGEVAYMGVSRRELISSQDVFLKMENDEEKACQCLSLTEEHIVKDEIGTLTRVWSFPHLSLQEFLAAYWLSASSWSDQCLSTRWIVNSDEHFSMFKMVLRFLCGLLSVQARYVLYILYEYPGTSPISMQNMPIRYYLDYGRSYVSSISPCLGWTELTKKYIEISEMLFESDCESICDFFPLFRSFLPQSLFFYFDYSSSPNEWECFVRSLSLLNAIQLIFFDTRYVTQSQFRSLATGLTFCCLNYLVVKLFGKTYSTLSAYSNVISQFQLTSDIKVCLELAMCSLTDTESSDHMDPASVFQLFANMSLVLTNLSPNCMGQITSRLISTDHLLYRPSDPSEYGSLLQDLFFASQLIALYLYNLTTEYEKQLENILPQLSNLQKIILDGEVPYSLLPHISSLSRLEYLHLRSDFQPKDTGHKDYLLQLLNTNSHTLRGLVLSHLESIGLNSWDELLTSLHSCTNLVQIQLWDTALQHDDVTLWDAVLSRIRCLLHLDLFRVTLSDAVLTTLCSGLLHHPTIRCMIVRNCRLSSNSCIHLRHLLPTLSHLETLDMWRDELIEPDPNPVRDLVETADLCFVNFKLLN